MWLRRLELLAGALGGALGLVALGYALFAPLSEECTGSSTPDGQTISTCSSISIAQAQGLGSLSFAIALFGSLSLGVAIFTICHSLLQRPMLLVLLWICAILLCFATLLAMFSIGMFFVPADALALVASIIGTVASVQPAPATA